MVLIVQLKYYNVYLEFADFIIFYDIFYGISEITYQGICHLCREEKLVNQYSNADQRLRRRETMTKREGTAKRISAKSKGMLIFNLGLLFTYNHTMKVNMALDYFCFAICL